MRGSLFSLALLTLLALLVGTAGAIVIGDHSTPEETCSDYKDSPPDFKECVKNVRAERLEHERFLRGPEREAKRKAAAAAQKKAAQDACIARGKKPGTVAIGMLAQDVRDCGWGNPSGVNRTTTAAGTTEQWVFRGGNYLYLENGKVTVIQH